MPKSSAGEYLCTLSAEDQEYAAKNLHEDPANRDAQIKSLQQWIKSRQYLHAHTDCLTVLFFLRGCKFNDDRARQKVINYYEMRANYPEWFSCRDPYLPQLQHLLKLGVFLPLQKRDPGTGRKVIIVRAAAHNPRKVSQNDVLKISKMVMEMVAFHEEIVSVYGVHAVIDLDNVTLGHALQMTPSIVQKLVHAWQECYPIRTRSIDFVNCPAHVNVVLNIFKRFMSQKMQSRIQVHGRGPLVNILPREILPEEYGGTCGNLEQLIGFWEHQTTSFRDWFLTDEEHKASLNTKT